MEQTVLEILITLINFPLVQQMQCMDDCVSVDHSWGHGETEFLSRQMKIFVLLFKFILPRHLGTSLVIFVPDHGKHLGGVYILSFKWTQKEQLN